MRNFVWLISLIEVEGEGGGEGGRILRGADSCRSISSNVSFCCEMFPFSWPFPPFSPPFSIPLPFLLHLLLLTREGGGGGGGKGFLMADLDK